MCFGQFPSEKLIANTKEKTGKIIGYDCNDPYEYTGVYNIKGTSLS